MTSGVPAAATITVDHLWACVDPALPELAPSLEFSRRRFDVGGQRGHQNALITDGFYRLDDLGRLFIRTGVVSRVIEQLRDLGRPVIVEDRRKFGRSHRRVKQLIEDATASDARFLRAAKKSMGQFLLSPWQDKSERILKICALYSKARIVIAVSTKRQAKTLRWKLRQLTGEYIGISVADSRFGSRARIVVCSFKHLTAMRWRKPAILLLPDGADAVGDGAQKKIQEMFAPLRTFAFLLEEEHLDQASQLILEAIAGPVIYRQSPKPAAVHVLLCPTHSFPKAEGLEGLERKRQAVWLNDRRNDKVAAVADAFASRDTASLWEHGLLLDQPEQYLRQFGTPFKIHVHVESTQHGDALRRRLAGWKVLSQCPDDDQDEGAGAKLIVTAAYAANHGLQPDVIIRADGLGGALPTRDFPPTSVSRSHRPILLVDFDDDFDPRARHDTRRRLPAMVSACVPPGMRNSSLSLMTV